MLSTGAPVLSLNTLFLLNESSRPSNWKYTIELLRASVILKSSDTDNHFSLKWSWTLYGKQNRASVAHTGFSCGHNDWLAVVECFDPIVIRCETWKCRKVYLLRMTKLIWVTRRAQEISAKQFWVLVPCVNSSLCTKFHNYKRFGASSKFRLTPIIFLRMQVSMLKFSTFQYGYSCTKKTGYLTLICECCNLSHFGIDMQKKVF